jgi:hypothetical protein
MKEFLEKIITTIKQIIIILFKELRPKAKKK